MNEHKQPEGASDPRNQTMLSQWLQQVLVATSASDAASSLSENEQNEYHPHFYQQLPDFVLALLNKQPQATLHYAPLLYHLVGCPTCHAAYLDLYAAMRAAIQPDQGNLTLSQRTATLEPTPPRMVVHLSQSLIRQAEAVLRQAHREHTDNSALARSLLQQAIRISAHVTQNHLRNQALQDLVRVATLFENASDSIQQGPAVHTYSPLPSSGKFQSTTVRRAETTLHATGTPAGQPFIHLQANILEGTITQHGETLELHLQDLNKALHGQFLTISIPLGSLIEPIRWHGGNPHTIRSVVPVDQHGMLNTPLGQTELQLSNPEERNLLEAIFMLLEVRTAD
jgi:hypothetical protein